MKYNRNIVFKADSMLELLSASCHSANEFSAILFLLLARSSSNSPQSLEGFNQTLVPYFIQSDNGVESGKCLQWGSMGKFITCCRIKLKFASDFARSSSNSPRSFQRFRQTVMRNFNWIRQQVKNFPIDPDCKNRLLSAKL